jgi:putative drug exporter of the RND superfamily
MPTPERLARFSTRRPWMVIGVWILLLLAGGAAASTIGGVLTTTAKSYVQTESMKADALIEQRLSHGAIPGNETVVVQSQSQTVNDPAFMALVTNIATSLRAMPGDVASVTTYYEAQSPLLVSQDSHTTILPVTLVGRQQEADTYARPIMDYLHQLDGKDGFTVVTGGDGSASVAFLDTGTSDLARAEYVGIPIAIVVLLLVFGALGAAGIPLLQGAISIVIGVGVTALVGRVFELSNFVTNMITMMGLALGIDYSLLIIQRFRDERRHGLDRDAAIVKAGATASRSVLFSGMAVVVALCGLLLVPSSIFRSLGVGAVIVVLVAIAAALTLLPAVLRLMGDRVNAVSIRLPHRASRTPNPTGQQTGFWDRTTRLVTRHPVMSVIASVAILVAAAVPYATMKLGNSGISTLPHDSDAYRAFSILNREFSAGLLAPAEVVIAAPDVTTPAIQADTSHLIADLGKDSVFGTPTIVTSPAKDLAVIKVPLTADPQGDSAHAAIHRLRDSYIPGAFPAQSASVLVTGGTATSLDITGVITGATLRVFAFVLGLSFLILLVVFRSIVVPLKAVVMNLLSVGASYGIMVLVFQHGVGNGIFGFQHLQQIDSWIPLFMFAILFGLSMDYHVFLLSRIRERFLHTHDNAESVAYGVRNTASMITGAALIMVAVFAGFASGKMVMFQQMGFGLAVAVLLDATLVRIVLVPAAMELLGDRNWYFPAWLNWLPRVDIEGTHLAETPASAEATPLVAAEA